MSVCRAREILASLLFFGLGVFCLVFYPYTALQWRANAKYKGHEFWAENFRDDFWTGIALFSAALVMFLAYLFLQNKSQDLLCAGVLAFVYGLSGIDFFHRVGAYVKQTPPTACVDR